MKCYIWFLDRKALSAEYLTNNNILLFQKERIELVETMKQNMSALIKSGTNEVELSFREKLKLRFSSRLQRKYEREAKCTDLLKEAIENIDEAFVRCRSNEKWIIIHLNTLFCLITFPPETQNLTHFSQVLHFMEEPFIWFAI